MPPSLTATPSPPEEEYPEHQKLHAVKDRSQVVGAFLDWLQHEREPHLTLCTRDDRDMLQPIGGRIEDLLAEYFEIDLDKLELEKVEMLAVQRSLNAKHEEEAKQAKRKKK